MLPAPTASPPWDEICVKGVDSTYTLDRRLLLAQLRDLIARRDAAIRHVLATDEAARRDGLGSGYCPAIDDVVLEIDNVLFLLGLPSGTELEERRR